MALFNMAEKRKMKKKQQRPRLSILGISILAATAVLQSCAARDIGDQNVKSSREVESLKKTLLAEGAG